MDKYIFEESGKTFVCFGWGAIQVGVSKDSNNQIMIHMYDVLRENEVGLNFWKWEEAEGKKVVLGFNSLESLEVLQEAIDTARNLFNKRDM